jgi:hypothetical protein
MVVPVTVQVAACLDLVEPGEPPCFKILAYIKVINVLLWK